MIPHERHRRHFSTTGSAWLRLSACVSLPHHQALHLLLLRRSLYVRGFYVKSGACAVHCWLSCARFSTRSGVGAYIFCVHSQREERMSRVVERARLRTRAPSSRRCMIALLKAARKRSGWRSWPDHVRATAHKKGDRLSRGQRACWEPPPSSIVTAAVLRTDSVCAEGSNSPPYHYVALTRCVKTNHQSWTLVRFPPFLGP